MAYTVGLGAVRGGVKGLTVRKALAPPLVASLLAVLLRVPRAGTTCSTSSAAPLIAAATAARLSLIHI